eukprot:CAMPEP_0175126904 /NCGR_PEP_ID=MMETSP0087-20121206/4108_1 /TAXON_ID=136419 /ORGANISM="Unknown Unknown, Strain D1" /LENGTH=464 /DNA_ID=CAMNT_0016408859 /DNA_START=157 /DNA_END=1551 /DNA_ORIENTATION=+
MLGWTRKTEPFEPTYYENKQINRNALAGLVDRVIHENLDEVNAKKAADRRKKQVKDLKTEMAEQIFFARLEGRARYWQMKEREQAQKKHQGEQHHQDDRQMPKAQTTRHSHRPSNKQGFTFAVRGPLGIKLDAFSDSMDLPCLTSPEAIRNFQKSKKPATPVVYQQVVKPGPPETPFSVHCSSHYRGHRSTSPHLRRLYETPSQSPSKMKGPTASDFLAASVCKLVDEHIDAVNMPAPVTPSKPNRQDPSLRIEDYNQNTFLTADCTTNEVSLSNLYPTVEPNVNGKFVNSDSMVKDFFSTPLSLKKTQPLQEPGLCNEYYDMLNKQQLVPQINYMFISAKRKLLKKKRHRQAMTSLDDTLLRQKGEKIELVSEEAAETAVEENKEAEATVATSEPVKRRGGYVKKTSIVSFEDDPNADPFQQYHKSKNKDKFVTRSQKQAMTILKGSTENHLHGLFTSALQHV